jgi:tRNA 2-selenouridine synthase SelU
MACSGCGQKRRDAAQRAVAQNNDEVMGGYKYLNDRQIKARLEVYKKKYCKGCDTRYECDYQMYVECKKNQK